MHLSYPSLRTSIDVLADLARQLDEDPRAWDLRGR